MNKDNYWIEYRNSIYQNKSKSQDDFEKYINLLATGGLILGFTFMEKKFSFSKISWLWMIICGLLCFTITLLSNLYSHHKSIKDSDEMINEIDNKLFDDLYIKTKKRNKIIDLLNNISIMSLFIGATLTILFITKNLYNMNSNSQNPQPKDIPNKINPGTGRTNPTPTPLPTPTPKK